jgi:Ca2+-binding RTX toxin-like protein
VLIGNATTNVLDGLAGADTMIGGKRCRHLLRRQRCGFGRGKRNEGLDTIKSTLSLVLGANVENLTLLGNSPINANRQRAEQRAERQLGEQHPRRRCGPTTHWWAARGTISTSSRASGDLVTEGASAGTDLVQASVSYTLATNVENLTLMSTTAINAVGNTLANVITGNSGVNRIDGGAGPPTA